jgi:hypothetical protein
MTPTEQIAALEQAIGILQQERFRLPGEVQGPTPKNIIKTMNNTIHTDAPEVRALVARAFPGFNGKRYRVNVFQGPMGLESYWSGGSRDYWAFVALDRQDHGAAHVLENGPPFNPSVQKLTELPLGVALVLHHVGNFEYAAVYVRAENMNRLALPAPVELSKEEKIVLAATRSLKSSYGGIKNYRFTEAASYTKITLEQWETAKASCTSKGLLNKTGAITDAGRNAIGDARVSDEALKGGAQ